MKSWFIFSHLRFFSPSQIGNLYHMILISLTLSLTHDSPLQFLFYLKPLCLSVKERTSTRSGFSLLLWIKFELLNLSSKNSDIQINISIVIGPSIFIVKFNKTQSSLKSQLKDFKCFNWRTPSHEENEPNHHPSTLETPCKPPLHLKKRNPTIFHSEETTFIATIYLHIHRPPTTPL